MMKMFVTDRACGKCSPAPAALLLAIGLAAAAVPAAAVDRLNKARAFAVLGSSTVTNTNATTIVGDIGVWPGTALTGASSITSTGEVHLADSVARQARRNASDAFKTIAGLPIGTDLSGIDLGTIGVLIPGTYSFSSSAKLTGSLLLDFTSNPGESFFFQIKSSLVTASDSAVNVLGGNADSGIFWNVGSSATLGTGTRFVGNIIAYKSITLNNSASITCGRAIALIGAVTMDGNTVSNDCRGAGDLGTGRTDFGSGGFSGGGGFGGGGGVIPEPASWAMMLVGFGAVGSSLRRRRMVAA